MHLRALEHSRGARSMRRLGAGIQECTSAAGQLSQPRPGRVGWGSPWPPPSSSGLIQLLLFCFFLPPPFSAVVAAGEYSRPACRRKEDLRVRELLSIPTEGLGAQALRVEASGFKVSVIPGEEEGAGGRDLRPSVCKLLAESWGSMFEL